MRLFALTFLFTGLFLGSCGGAAPPSAVPASQPVRVQLTDADYQARGKKLRESLPATGNFTILVQKPFVIIGDGTPEQVRNAAEKTVKWAVDHLKKDFFDNDPPEILDVYLFKDKDSYDRYTKELFNDAPDTPYGYYSPAHKALIMNIGTGGGTLVHEIVHPYMAANFPFCPTWFNEGMGSLFEQSADRNGHIIGQTNWRLAGLQQAIEQKTTLPFKDIFAMNSVTFYGKNRGVNYAQSRYLCYYLQEKGLLQTYYKTFLKNREKDPTGYDTLIEILKEKDIPAFQKNWEAWVLTLKFP